MKQYKILIAGASNQNYAEVSDLTINNQLVYSAKHEYGWRHSEHSQAVKDLKAISKEKIQFMQEALSMTEWLFWMDMDAIFTNMNIKIESIIERNPDKDFIIANDVNGPNNGIILMRSSTAVKIYLNDVLEKIDSYAHDNEAMVSLIGAHSEVRCSIIGQKEMNSMPYWLYNYGLNAGSWLRGDFIFHAAGMSMPEKVAAIKSVLYLVQV